MAEKYQNTSRRVSRSKKRNKKTKSSVFISITFILVSILFLMIAITRGLNKTEKETIPRSKIIMPTYSGDGQNKLLSDVLNTNNEVQTSFVPLHTTETLISTLSIDLNNDMKEDQVIAVRKNAMPNIVLVVGIYDAQKNAYIRVAEIATTISRTRTFSYTGIDMLGEHQNSLVYQGVKDDGTSVMCIYMMNEKRGEFELTQIGNFESDGTIFIQQDDRTISYELSQSRGTSFPVWVYSSARDEGDGTNTNLSQIQTEYRWNAREKKYIETKKIRVTGSKLAAQELARIQDGTVETFANFLSGLWYKTSNTNNSVRYLFFDYEQNEIIFMYDDTEEVYAWEDSNLRRSGIYITTTNKSITNMQRRCDISLAGIDEIRIHITDDVRMLIKENNLWDGSYRKMSSSSILADDIVSIATIYEKELIKGPSWITDNGLRLTFKDSTYTLSDNTTKDTGSFITGIVADKAVIQFRSDTNSKMLSSAYELSFDKIAIDEAKDAKEETKDNLNSIKLQPVRLSPDTSYPIEGRVFTLSRDVPNL